ncbi:MAG TPA: VOC family protein [Streptosporangiaceae bacterium]|jgi:catechol 2,3-dioxygenase-like lactoylglutathione lyase family enzyme
MSEVQVTGIATVGIPVTDQQRAVDFYVGTLGFEMRRDPGGNSLIVVESAQP